MPFNPAGVFSLPPGYFAEPGTTVLTSQHNPPLEDVASALSQTLVRDGRASMTGPLNMNNFAITNIAPGNSPSNVATLAQAMPIGAVIDFAGSSAPAGWMLCFGQELVRTAYPLLFAVIGTTFGGAPTTFRLPDCRGRITAAADNMGGSAAGRLTTRVTPNGNTLGATGGVQELTLGTANLPPYTPAGTINQTVSGQQRSKVFDQNAQPGSTGGIWQSDGQVDLLRQPEYGFTGTPQGGTSTPLTNVQPTIIMNKIIRTSYDG